LEARHFEKAIRLLTKVVALTPDYGEAHSNLGNAYLAIGDLKRSVFHHRRAVTYLPESGRAHFNLAVAHFHAGDLKRGFAEFEWRHRGQEYAGRRRPLVAPEWDGSPALDKTLLLAAEQGLGDTLQFARYIPAVATRVGRIVLECQPDLAPLLRTLPEVSLTVVPGTPLPPIDIQAALGSLPHLLAGDEIVIPTPPAYLEAPAGETRTWNRRLRGPGLAVGLVWQGNPQHPEDAQRSLRLIDLEPVLTTPHCRFYSLQIDPGRHQLAELPGQIAVADLAQTTLNQAASILCSLDVLISVDTSVAHLSGALGRRCWLLLKKTPDWRWGLSGSKSRWYPSLRLFRQIKDGAWAEPIAEIGRALSAWAVETADGAYAGPRSDIP
jgi:hypothetical protein